MNRAVLGIGLLALGIAGACSSPVDAQTPAAGSSELIAGSTYTLPLDATSAVELTPTPLNVAEFEEILVSVQGGASSKCQVHAVEPIADGTAKGVRRGTATAESAGPVATDSNFGGDGESGASINGPLLIKHPILQLRLQGWGAGAGECSYKVVGRR